MNHSDPFQNIFPFILERVAQGVGDLIGVALELQDGNIVQGNFDEIFSPPREKSILISFDLKDNPDESAYLLVTLDMAIDFGSSLIMLPENEIIAYKKLETLEGEILDAFSETVNIISGAINSTCQEYISKRKLHFTKGNLEFFPSESNFFPLHREKLSLISGIFNRNQNKSGSFYFFLPHSLLLTDEHRDEAKNPAEGTQAITAQKSTSNEIENINAGKISEKSGQNNTDTFQDVTIECLPIPEKSLDSNMIKGCLMDGIAPAQGELGALLGASIEFIEQKTQNIVKKDLLSNIKDKQVLTKFLISGERKGEGYILFSLKDAIYFGAILLMIPPDSITEAINAGKFEGEIADAFGEITNILIGCCSNQFKTNFPLKLQLKKDTLETLVPSQVDLDSTVPFEANDFFIFSARIKMDGNHYGPMEIIFPSETLGLLNVDEFFENSGEKKVFREKTSQVQQHESLSENQDANISSVVQENHKTRIISIISQDTSNTVVFEENFIQENVEVVHLSPESDLKQNLSHKNLLCVFLFIKRVNDSGLAQTIKVRGALKKNCPLIVAGPDWTRTSVLKALKYGATDILITPIHKDSIWKKCQKHLHSD